MKAIETVIRSGYVPITLPLTAGKGGQGPSRTNNFNSVPWLSPKHGAPAGANFSTTELSHTHPVVKHCQGPLPSSSKVLKH